MSFNDHECGFCKSQIPTGASVCAHCGAHKGREFESGGSFFLGGLVVGVLFSMAGIGGLYAGYEKSIIWGFQGDQIFESLMILIVASGFTYFWLKMGVRKTWLRRN